MIELEVTGSFKNLEKFLKAASKEDFYAGLDALAQRGVEALAANTPKDTGATASSWDYTIKKSRGRLTITWTNSHVDSGVPVAIILQCGHATGTGGYVAGTDYINPAIKPIFDDIARQVWKKVTK